MSGVNYGLGDAAGWLERQQRRIGELEAENRELRRQLEELKHGVGITVLIHGRPVALAPHGMSPTGHNPAYAPMPALLPAPPAAASQPMALPAPQSAHQPTYAQQPAYPAQHAQEAQAAQAAQQSYWPPLAPATPTAHAPTQHPRHAAPFAEDAWLTDHMPAITAHRPIQPTAPRAMRTGAPSRTSARSAQGVPPQVPTWLLDDPAVAQRRETGAPSERARAEANRRGAQHPYDTAARSSADPRGVAPGVRPTAQGRNTGQHRAVARPSAFGKDQAPRRYHDDEDFAAD